MKHLLKLLFLLFTMHCALCTMHCNAQWQQTNGPYGGPIRCLAIKGDTIFAGTWGGVFLSTNNGSSWSAMNNGLTDSTDVSSIAISGRNVFAGTNGGGVFLSTNKGESWKNMNNGLTSLYITSLAIKGDTIFAGTAGGTFLTTNNGANWTAENNGLYYISIFGDTIYVSANSFAISGKNIFAGGDGVYLSTNNGTSWTAVNNGLPYYYIFGGDTTYTYVNSLAINGNNIFAGTGAGVFLSTNNGTSWSAVNNGLPDSITVNTLAINGKNIFAGVENVKTARGYGVFLSTNNGTNWSAVNKGLTDSTDVSSLAISGGNVFVGTERGVFLSTNNGSNWTSKNTGIYMPVTSLAISGSKMFAGTKGGLFLSTDNGGSWNDQNDIINLIDLNGSVYYEVDDFSSILISGTNIFAGTSGGVFASSDNGVFWTIPRFFQFSGSGMKPLINILSLAMSGKYIFAGTDGDGVLLSTNNGSTWVILDSTVLFNTSVTSLVIDSVNIYAGTKREGVFLSTNNGTSWKAVNNGLPYTTYISSLAINEKNDVFAAAADLNKLTVGLYLSTNNGGSWNEEADSGFPNKLLETPLVISGGNIFAGGGGAFLSTNNGGSWVNTGLNEDVLSFAISGGYIYAGTVGTVGAGVWKRALSEMIGFDSIHGNLTYNNIYNTPIKNTKLYLINSNSTIIDSTITDTVGHYVFTNVVNDSYTIQLVITIPWGGGNPIDALIINRSYISLYTFTDALLKRAGDVNGDGKLNPIDALLVNRRYIHLINKFTIPDWLYETPTITVNNSAVHQNIKTVCAGDVNGSYIPK